MVSDYRRRFAPTLLGGLWFLAPLLTGFAIAGSSPNFAGTESTSEAMLRIALYVCSLQLVSDCVTETSRLARKNRALLPQMGHKSSTVNFAAIFGSELQFALKVLLCISVFIVLGTDIKDVLNICLVLIVWHPSLICIGLLFSYLLSYPSLLFLDLRYATQYLPMLLLVVFGNQWSDASLDQTGFSPKSLNPLLALTRVGGSSTLGNLNLIYFVAPNIVLICGLLFIARLWQRQVFKFLTFQYL